MKDSKEKHVEYFLKLRLGDRLNEEKQKSIHNTQAIEESTKLLTEGVDKKKRALEIAGLNKQEQEAETRRGVEIDRKKLEEEYNSNVFTRKELRNICIKYDLRLLPSIKYSGKVESEVANKLSEFIEGQKEEIGNSSKSFYMIAPSTSFSEDNNKLHEFFNSNVEPILLYKVPKHDKFVFIHSWGKGFSIFRRIRGMYMEGPENMISIGMSSWVIIISILFGTFNDSFVSIPVQYFHMLWIATVSLLLSYATMCVIFNRTEDFDRFSTERRWDNLYYK